MPPSQHSQILYTIFTVDMPPMGKAAPAPKENQSTADMDQALKQAESLFATDSYLKVEVKKKYAEEKTGRLIEISLKSFERKAKKDYTLILFTTLALLGGIAAFAGAYFLTRDSQPVAASAGNADNPAPPHQEH